MEHELQAVSIPRVSSKRQEEEGYSLSAQRKFLDSYALNKGLQIVKTFEITETASKAIQRRIFKEAMKFIEANNIKHIIIEKVDRHVRNLQDAVETHNWLTADETRRIHFVKDSLVMHKNSRSQEWLNWGIRVVMAKNYIDNLREEAMKGWAEKLAQGWLPAPPPPGYKTVSDNGKKIHVPDPKTAPLIRQAFKLYLQPNHSIATVAKELELMGITTRKGRPYYKSQVQRLLTNPFYIGTNQFNGKDYPGMQETIISKQVFDAVQVKMRRKLTGRYRKHNPVFKSLIRCNNCGKLVTWQLQKGRYYGACQRNTEVCKGRKLIREDELEERIVQLLEGLVTPRPEVIDWVASAMKERHKVQIDKDMQLASSIQSRIDQIERMDNNLYDDKLANAISQEKYEEKHLNLMLEKEALVERLGRVDQSKAMQLEKRLVLLELSQRAAEIYKEKAPEQKRLIITKLFSDLTYDGGILSVSYTNFCKVLAQNVQLTRNLLGGAK